MKKAISIFLATLLVASVMVLGTSAADEVKVSLKGSSQAIIGEKYEVTLNAPTTVGGISGEIDYDETKFDLTDIKITAAFAAANKIDAVEGTELINDDGNVIMFSLLPNKMGSNNWITFVFDVLETADTGKSSFNIGNVKVSDAEGVNFITEGLTTESVSDTSLYTPALNVVGASVKTDGAADIRFEIDLGANTYKDLIEEIGVIMIPTRFVAEGQELDYDTENVKYSGKTAKKARSFAKDMGDETIFYANLINSSATASRINTAVSARAYVKLIDGTIIYSDNAVSDKNIAGGTSSRSCIDVMKSVAAANGYIDDAEESIKGILDKANKDWTLEDYAAVVKAVNDKLLGK